MNSMLLDSTYEFGLRALLILVNKQSACMSCERIMYYDYYTTYNLDIINGCDVITVLPPYPYRGAELFNKKQRMQNGLTYFAVKDLISVLFDDNGIRYYANANTHWMYSAFLKNAFAQKYVRALLQCSTILDTKTDQDILLESQSVIRSIGTEV